MARTLRWIAPTLALLLPMAGCGLEKPDPAKSYFAFDVPPPAAAEGARRDDVLRVARARVAPPFNEVTFHYLVGAGEYKADYYVNFVAPPERLVTGQLIAWLEASGPYAHAVGGGSTVGTSATLECAVTALYADYTDREAPAAIVRVSAFLLDESDVDATVLLQRDYAERVPITGDGPAAIVEAWNAALATIFTALGDDLRGVPPPGERGG